ncbi:hypothetical protein SAMN04487866_11950 [Thermoactinomyces sp. DSM 45891]|nr:hypothetical protein SAMN04487866_11950 [Thermoactinomyces sp. DSM 45891]
MIFLKRRYYLLITVLLSMAYSVLIEWEIIVFPEPWIKRLASFVGLLTIVLMMRYFGRKRNE